MKERKSEKVKNEIIGTHTGLTSFNVVLEASIFIALKTLGANIIVQNLSHMNVPKIVLTTKITTLYLYVSLGKGAN